MSFPVGGQAVEGTPFREAQSCLTPAFANSTYKFFLSGTSTPANVYQDGALTTPFPITGVVPSDSFGRFPAIYLDTSVIYRVQFFDNTNTQRWQQDPYTSQLATVGTSALSAFGFQIATTGEFIIDAPNTGGTGVSLTLKSGALGTAALEIVGTLAGNSALIINSSATTGAQTATFAASNKPGTATSAPAGWLPITCDGVQYYTPIWHGNPFTPYISNPSALGEVIVGSSVTFGGTGLTTVTNGTATPSNWFTPVFTNVGAGYYINITKTAGLSGLAFSAAQGAWTNIGAGGLMISSNAQAQITGTYQLSTSVTGSPVVAAGTITLKNNNGVQSPSYNGTAPFIFAGNGTSFLNGVATYNWYAPTTSNIGSGFYVKITQTGGTPGYIFNNATGAYTNITNSGTTIPVSGTGATTFSVTGTYTIASDSGGVNQLGNGFITLSGSNVQSPTWNGGSPLTLSGNGAASLFSGATSSWYSPNSANVGSGFWFNITRTGGTSGVNFSVAQGAWTNITNSGLTTALTGYTGDVGSVNATGTWQISNSSSGTPVLGSGTVTLAISGLTVLHVYTTGTSVTETVPTGTSTVVIEVWGGPGGGGGGNPVTTPGGSGGGGPGYSRSSYAATGGKTVVYTAGAFGTGGAAGVAGTAGTASTVVSGTLTITTMTANGGGAGAASGGAVGAGGTASGGNQANTTGGSGSVGNLNGGGAGGTPPTGVHSSGSSGGSGGIPLGGAGNNGTGNGVVVFFYS